MLRKTLIAVNYLAVIFIIWSAIIGFLITRGKGFEYHLWVSLASIALTMYGHIGSASYLFINKKDGLSINLLIILNCIGIVFYLWGTWAGYIIRQGVPFVYHLQVSIAAFFFSVSAHILSAIYLKIKYQNNALQAEEV